jgi:hypothetical protein
MKDIFTTEQFLKLFIKIKIATINFSADGNGSNRPTITITTRGGSNSNGSNSPTFNISSAPTSPLPFNNNNNNSAPGFSYNIPIQYVQQSNMGGQLQSPNFILQDKANNQFSYTLPVNSNVNTNINPNNNNNRSFNISVTSSSTGENNKNVNLNNSNNINNKTRVVEDQVDLLKDLLMKNLNAPASAEFYGYCMRCNEKIIGAENGLKAMDNVFHVRCFSCYACGVGLNGKHFYAMDENSYCELCYTRLLEKCSLCFKPITERVSHTYMLQY